HPYKVATPKSFGIPDDMSIPKNQIYGFNIKNEVNQDKIDRWVESEKARNEQYDKRNQDMVSAIVQNAAQTSTDNKPNNKPKTIEDWAREGTDPNNAFAQSLKKGGNIAGETNRA